MTTPDKQPEKVPGTRTAFLQLHQFRPVLLLRNILVGVLTGLVVVGFRMLLDQSVHWRHATMIQLRQAGPMEYAIWILVLTVVGILIGLAAQYYPLIRGSGIPQVKGVMTKQLGIKWFPEILLKFFGGITALGLGMSLGREGPSIQLGSFVGEGVLSLSKRPDVERKFLISSGAAAGVAAAFNAPLAGVIFVLEELHKTLSPLMLMCVMGASLAADLVAGRYFGLQPIFDFHAVEALPHRYFPYILILGVLVAFSGDVFKRLLYFFQDLYIKARIPRFLRPVLPLLVSFFIGIWFFQITGGGHEMIESLVDTKASLRYLSLLLVLKVLLTVFCYGSTTPGGIFLPLLLMGALIGRIFGGFLLMQGLIGPEHLLNFMILGMAAQFTSIVRAPVTGSILVLEMCGNMNHLSGLVGICMVSYVVADFIHSRPVYDVLLQRMISRNPAIVQGEAQKVILEIPVCASSLLDRCLVKDVPWPEEALLVGIRRGELEHIPKGHTEIIFGDTLLVLVPEPLAPEINVKLLNMGTEEQ
jgi:H+/Cl- antiporter ClcA